MRRSRAHGPGRCAVCERMILPGEPVSVFAEPDRGGRRRIVCPLCPRRALARGWDRTAERAEPDRDASAA